MKHLIVIKIAVLLVFNYSYSQDRIDYKKDTIYIKFDKNDGTQPKYRGVKFYKKDEKGTVFNHLNGESFLFKDSSKSDTLDIARLGSYKIFDLNDINEKIKTFNEMTYQKLPLKDEEKMYQFYNKNDLFVTYLIEELENRCQIVVYPVIWRWQNIEPNNANTRFGKD